MLKRPFASIFLVAIALFLCSSQVKAKTFPLDEEKIEIIQSTKKLSFYINKKKELRAKLNVSQTLVSKTALKHTFSKSIFFDNYSAITKINEVINSRKRRKLTPIVSDYESDGIFHSDLKVSYFEYDFTELSETFTYEYEKEFSDLKFLDPLYFNDVYPINNSQLIIEIPEGIFIDIRELNFDLEQPKTSTSQEKKSTIYHYSMANLPAAFKYKGAPRRSKFNAHLIFISNAYEVNGSRVKLIEKVDDLYNWYASLVANTKNDSQGLDQIVQELTAGKTDDLEKIKAIFYWVQDNIRYIAFEYGIMGFQPEACQTVYKNKYGDCKGMANLTKEMLLLAGYDARLTWLGTADVPYGYDIPSLMVDNHMICTVILNGEKIFLDPTEKYAALYNYAFRIQGQEALIEDGANFMIERIPILASSSNKEFSKVTLSIDKEKISGTGQILFQGNRKTSIFNRLSSIPEKDWKSYLVKYISNYDKNIEVNIEHTPKFDDRDQDFSIDYTLDMEHHVIDLGEELYVNMEYDYSFKGFLIQEERNVPYEFSGKYYIENTVTLAIPEGWNVSYLPNEVNQDTEKYAFQLSYEEKDGQLVYYKKITIKDVTLGLSDFSSWNETIQQLDAFYADQIILKK